MPTANTIDWSAISAVCGMIVAVFVLTGPLIAFAKWRHAMDEAAREFAQYRTEASRSGALLKSSLEHTQEATRTELRQLRESTHAELQRLSTEIAVLAERIDRRAAAGEGGRPSARHRSATA